MSIVKTILASTMLATAALAAPIANANPSVEEIAHIKATADITVGLKGLVCDFCSIALNKTFKKHKAVAATYVDLDTKAMSVVLKDGMNMNDAELTKLVESAGYNVNGITRKDG
ncbi:hypothetical protein [Fretibacter rubidus]|uniref:hypothetical protein n=1 Tax=Fretibacter rubidus TaxID=570162 RepID=UPI00352B27D6